MCKYFLYLSTCSPQLVLLTRQNVLCCSINRLFLHFTGNLVEPSLSVSLDCCCGLAALALWGYEKRQVSVGRKHPGRTHAPVCFVIFCPGAQRRANFIKYFYQCMTCPVWNTGCEWKENEDWWLRYGWPWGSREGRGFVLEAVLYQFDFKQPRLWKYEDVMLASCTFNFRFTWTKNLPKN